MIKFILNIKNLFLIIPYFSLLSSSASSHTGDNSEFGIGHTLLSVEHCIPLVFLGISVAILMLTRRRPFIFIGNLWLLLFLIYQFIFHSFRQNILFGLFGHLIIFSFVVLTIYNNIIHT